MSYEESYELYLEGKRLYDNSKLEGAIEKFKLSHKAFPHYKSLELWGDCELKRGNPRLAIMPLTASTELNSSIRAKGLLAQAYESIGDIKRAVSLSQEVIRRAHGNKIAKRILHEYRDQI